MFRAQSVENCCQFLARRKYMWHEMHTCLTMLTEQPVEVGHCSKDRLQIDRL